MVEQIVLGIIQGIAEWLPVSSEGLLLLAQANFFPSDRLLGEAIGEALFLHLGTFFAALVYFRHDVAELFKALFNYKEASATTKSLFRFLLVSTFLSGFIGFIIAEGEGHTIGPAIGEYAHLINAGIGVMLLLTGGLLLWARRSAGHKREIKDLNFIDGILLGIVQGFAAVPGLSRSGLTMSALLLRRVREQDALRVSFLMSLPIVFAANVFINPELLLNLDLPHLVGLLTSFGVGLLTIHGLLRIAKRINFGLFVVIFGVLLLVAAVL